MTDQQTTSDKQAEWFGAQNATAMSSAGGLLALALTYPWWRDLLRPRNLAST